jgi:hypothetical protein
MGERDRNVAKTARRLSLIRADGRQRGTLRATHRHHDPMAPDATVSPGDCLMIHRELIQLNLRYSVTWVAWLISRRCEETHDA